MNLCGLQHLPWIAGDLVVGRTLSPEEELVILIVYFGGAPTWTRGYILAMGTME